MIYTRDNAMFCFHNRLNQTVWWLCLTNKTFYFIIPNNNLPQITLRRSRRLINNYNFISFWNNKFTSGLKLPLVHISFLEEISYVSFATKALFVGIIIKTYLSVHWILKGSSTNSFMDFVLIVIYMHNTLWNTRR